jgi:hypothetical protein
MIIANARQFIGHSDFHAWGWLKVMDTVKNGCSEEMAVAQAFRPALSGQPLTSLRQGFGGPP